MRTLQPENHQDRVTSLCAPCVYFSKNLDPSFLSPSENARDLCGLGYIPGDESCKEMRTNNCGMRKNKN